MRKTDFPLYIHANGSGAVLLDARRVIQEQQHAVIGMANRLSIRP